MPRPLQILCQTFNACVDCRADSPEGVRFRGMLKETYQTWECFPDGCPRKFKVGEHTAILRRPLAGEDELAGYVPTPENATAGGCGCDPPKPVE